MISLFRWQSISWFFEIEKCPFPHRDLTASSFCLGNNWARPWYCSEQQIDEALKLEGIVELAEISRVKNAWKQQRERSGFVFFYPLLTFSPCFFSFFFRAVMTTYSLLCSLFCLFLSRTRSCSCCWFVFVSFCCLLSELFSPHFFLSVLLFSLPFLSPFSAYSRFSVSFLFSRLWFVLAERFWFWFLFLSVFSSSIFPFFLFLPCCYSCLTVAPFGVDSKDNVVSTLIGLLQGKSYCLVLCAWQSYWSIVFSFPF